MGCGSSSLKGEKTADLAGEQPQPITRVKTNFSEVNFTGNGNGGGRGKSFAVAPDESSRPPRISEDPIPSMSQTGSGTADGQPLAPYQTIAGDDGLASPTAMKTTAYPHELPSSDPTSAASKAAFASANEPIHETGGLHVPQPNEISAAPEAGERKKSWYARYQDHVSGRNSADITDDELQRLLGMTREQWNAYKNDPNNAVGPRQRADRMPIGSGGAFVAP
jgi:hypothetical protein